MGLNSTRPCPMVFRFDLNGTTYHVMMNSVQYSGTDDALVTCTNVVDPTHPSTSQCNGWRITPTATNGGTDLTLQPRNLTRLAKTVQEMGTGKASHDSGRGGIIGGDAPFQKVIQSQTETVRRDNAGWIYSGPAFFRQPNLAPGMTVRLANHEKMSKVVILSAQISNHYPSGNSGQPHQGSEACRVMFAKADPAIKQEVFEVVVLVLAWSQ